jgi:hypothetical protein
MTEYLTGLQLLQLTRSVEPLSTGSPELDQLIGGIQRSLFYLFYGEEPLVDILFQHLITHALKTNESGRPRIIYMLAGNYRKERTNLSIEELAELLEDSGYQMWEALRRVQVFTASSADQQANMIHDLLGFLRNESNVSLVLIRGIYKLAKDDARQRNRYCVYEEVQRSINNLRQICAEKNFPLIASGRVIKPSQSVTPVPESSMFLRHCANVVVYLRRRSRGSYYNRAFLIDHPTRAPASVEYHHEVDCSLGRETKPFRMSYQDLVDRLRRELHESLRSEKRRNAFDMLVGAWSDELGAMSYAESFKMIDLMLLVSALENRSLLENLLNQLEAQRARLERLEENRL